MADIRGAFIFSHVLHDFVLTFPRNVHSRKYDIDVAPPFIILDFVLDEKFQGLVEIKHELSPRTDAISIEIRVGYIDILSFLLFYKVRHVISCSVPALPLIVHLRTWSHAVNRNIENLPRLYQLKEVF